MMNELDARLSKKKCYKIVLLYLAISCIISCTMRFDEQDLYGIWEGGNKDLEMSITFNKNSTCEIEFREEGSDPVTITGDFEVDFTKKPIPLSIRNIPKLNHPLHTIIQFNSIDILRMAEFSPRWRLRPVSFSQNTELILMRMKE